MTQKIKKFTEQYPRLKKVVAWVLITVGFFALVTPLTPGGLLFFVGLELLGVRLLFVERFFERRAARKAAVVK